MSDLIRVKLMKGVLTVMDEESQRKTVKKRANEYLYGRFEKGSRRY